MFITEEAKIHERKAIERIGKYTALFSSKVKTIEADFRRGYILLKVL
jgi:hypothetical protein